MYSSHLARFSIAVALFVSSSFGSLVARADNTTWKFCKKNIIKTIDDEVKANSVGQDLDVAIPNLENWHFGAWIPVGVNVVQAKDHSKVVGAYQVFIDEVGMTHSLSALAAPQSIKNPLFFHLD